MTDILKYIKLGTSTKEWFNYDGQPLPIRPLSSYEIDEIMLKVLQEGITQQIYESVYRVKMNLIDPMEEVKLDLKDYKEFFYYYNIIDYWIVYYSMKDFQPEEFSQPDYDEEFKNDYDDWKENNPKGYYIVRKMKYVHRIENDIMSMTSQPLIKIGQVLKNDRGKILASMVYTFHHPLSSEAWKITPLQEDFLLYSRPGAPQIISGIEDLPGIKAGSLKDIAEQLNKLVKT